MTASALHAHLFSTVFFSPLCSATMTMLQCAARTIRTTRTSVSCAGMPASSSLKYLLCQKAPVLLVCIFTLWCLRICIHKKIHFHMHTSRSTDANTPLQYTLNRKHSSKEVTLTTEHFLHSSLEAHRCHKANAKLGMLEM